MILRRRRPPNSKPVRRSPPTADAGTARRKTFWPFLVFANVATAAAAVLAVAANLANWLDEAGDDAQVSLDAVGYGVAVVLAAAGVTLYCIAIRRR